MSRTASSLRRDVYEDIDIAARPVVGSKSTPRYVTLQDCNATALRFKQRAPSPVDDDEQVMTQTLGSDSNDTSQLPVLLALTDHPQAVCLVSRSYLWTNHRECNAFMAIVLARLLMYNVSRKSNPPPKKKNLLTIFSLRLSVFP